MSTTRKQGWLDRQRQARRSGWRVRVQRHEGAARKLRAERRGDQTCLAMFLVGCLPFAGAALGVTFYGAMTSEPVGEALSAGVLSLVALLVLVLLVGSLFTIEESGWRLVPIDKDFPSMSSEEVAAAVEGVEPVRVGGREWRCVPDERVQALDAAADRAQQALHEELEAKRVAAARRAEEEVAAAARADDHFLERLQGRGPKGGEAQQRLEKA